MFVYIISKQKLISFTLPSKINGSYFIKDESKNIINISESNGKWLATSNRNYKIMSNDDKELKSAYLANYQFLLLKEVDTGAYFIIYSVNVNDDNRKYYEIKGDNTITIGNKETNDICYLNKLVENSNLNLTYKGNSWLLEEAGGEYKAFVNGEPVAKQMKLNHGDIIFLMGLKIIAFSNRLIIGAPHNSVHVNSNKLTAKQITKGTPKTLSQDSSEVELYEEKDYFERSPRFMQVIDKKTFKVDPHPQMPEEDQTPLLLTVGPMLTMGSVSLVMMVVAFMSLRNGTGNAMSVMPTLVMSFSMLGGTLLWPTLNRRFMKKQHKKKKAKIEKKYNEYLEKKEQELKEIAGNQKQILLSNNKSPLECYNIITQNSRSLWERELHQNDFLNVRLGIGKIDLNIGLDFPGEKFSVEEDTMDEKMRVILDKYKEIDGVPEVLSLVKKNILSITGKYAYTKRFLDILLVQLMALHSYYDLKIIVFTNEEKAKYWEFMHFLPHAFDDSKNMRFFSTKFEEGREISAYLQKVLSARKEVFKESEDLTDAYKRFATYYLIITDDYKQAKEFGITSDVLESKVNYGFSYLILNPNLANLPTQCNGFINLEDMKNGITFESELSEETERKFTIEENSNFNLNYCALKLANIPIRNKLENYVMPKTLNFLEMYDIGMIEQLNALDRWKNNNPIVSLGAPIGIDEHGNILRLDLHERKDGPHGLVAGMTGSGKSEFLMTYILSMAINYHPEEVSFVLIDYKGGGLAGAFESKETGVKLPHLAGTITNLDAADISRSLASIESELKRRQALFNEAREKIGEGTIDIYKYQKYYREGLLKTPISHLVIISDEFAELKQQQPEFMDQLISTSRIGRSLGVHLILATQKPSGIVNDQIWSNTRFRVCLKVQDASDSNEVIKRPDAADLKDAGRFYLQVGYNELFLMGQSAYSGALYIPQERVYKERDDSIVFIDGIGRSIKTISAPKSESTVVKGEQLPQIVKYLSNLAKNENISIPKLWLDKLQTNIFVDELRKKYRFAKRNFILQSIVGEYDNPKEQKQGLLTIDLNEKGNTVIYSMNEKITITNSIIYSLITTYTTEEVNIYIMDFDSETLKMYKTAPQVGDVIFANETEKIDKLLGILNSEIENRKRIFQEYNGSYDFYIRNSNKTMPNIVLIVTGYEGFKEAYEDEDTLLQKIARDGHKYGVHVILTAISDRSLRLGMRSSFPNIIPLKLASQIEYNMLLGKKAPDITDADNRGAALIGDEIFEFQTASVCEESKLNDYIKQVTSTLKQNIKLVAPEIPVLPEKVTIKDVLASFSDYQHIPIGLEAISLGVVTYDFTKSKINLINSEEVEMMNNFTDLVIKETNMIGTIDTMVIDLNNAYTNSNYAKSIYLKATDDVFNKFNEEVTKQRDKPLLVFINGVDKFINLIPDDIKNNLSDYLNKLNNVHLIFIARIIDMKNIAYETWFKANAALDEGIWIGRGLGSSTIHSLVTPLRELNEPIESNFGYVIQKGNAIKMKVLEGEDNGE